MTNKETILPLPANPIAPNLPRCADILAEETDRNPGVIAAIIDQDRATLTITYDPDFLSLQGADDIALNLSQRINQREAACNNAYAVRCVDCVAAIPPGEPFENVAIITQSGPIPPKIQRYLNLTDTALARVEKKVSPRYSTGQTRGRRRLVSA